MPRNTTKSIRLYRGTTQQHSDYAGPVGEITVDTEKYTVVVQNGVTGGVPLAREDTVVSLTNRITDEASARETADTALQKSITDEASARETADTALQKSITDEVSARKAADTTLQNNIDSEASARETADTALQKSITDEVSARKAADTALQKKDTTLQNNIDSEASARETADTALQKSITDEASARETADNAFQEQIDNTLRRGAVIGEIRWFAMSTPPEGWLVCNGAAVGTSDYAALFAAIGKTFTPKYIDDPELKIPNPEYENQNVFQLPNLMRKVPWGSSSQVGTVKSAGLPNITGSFELRPTDSGASVTWETNNGAIKVVKETSGGNTCVTESPSNGFAMTVSIDASRSSSIYGNSTTVQPPALCLLPCIRYE